MSYQSARGRVYDKAYPYVRYSHFSEFDIRGMDAALKSPKPRDPVMGSFQADMEYLAFVSAREGSSLAKILVKKRKSSRSPKRQEELRILTELVELYGVVEKPLGPIDVTLWRIGALYCREICTYFHEGKIKPFLTQGQLGLGETGGFPASMMHPAFGRMIPSFAASTSGTTPYINPTTTHHSQSSQNGAMTEPAAAQDSTNTEIFAPIHPFDRSESIEGILRSSDQDDGEGQALISPEDYECLYYGYAHHQRTFYSVLTSTTKGTGPRSRKKLKEPRDILNYIDEQIAYPLMSDKKKLEFLEKLNILVKCEYLEDGVTCRRNIYYLESGAKLALKRCKDAWNTYGSQTQRLIVTSLENDLEAWP